jgi:hypothetical protein
MQYADGEGQCGSLCSFGAINVWDVENTWLVSLIRISGCRQMKGIWISNIRRRRKHSGSKPGMGRSRDACNGIRHSGIEYSCMESDAYKICEGWAT